MASILVVDDVRANLHLLVRILTKHGYRVRPASNGSRALAAVQRELPGLILLDVKMPEMSGYQVCEQLKADERTRDIPVIFISALNEVLDKVKAFSAGGVDYITKPFQVEEVLARVETHLTLRNMQKSLEQEIVERKRAEEALRQRTVELEAHNEELGAFAHTVAHDLKNPLSLIIGYAGIWEERATTLDEESRSYLHTIVQNGYKMADIIEALLLLAGVRQMEAEVMPLDMGSIVAGALQRLTLMIEEHHAEIILPDTWPVVLGYGVWVEEVWVNYLDNAIKYGGRPPRVEIGATEQTSPTDQPMVRFWVRDNGAGISAEAQNRLFTPFTRLDQVNLKGHGLGLSIARRIVEKLGGEVSVESQEGQGSTFTFTLPGAP